tara:strand:+ start:548 stop:946 length:399 start_codon:yes stop_codon:yes gene_type:complete
MENLDEALALLITKALEGVDTSVGFLQAELPDVVTQLLMWHGVRSGVVAVLGLGLFIATWYWVFRLFAKIEKQDDGEWNRDLPPKVVIKALVFVSVGVLGTTLSFDFINLTWLQIWIAPKVWLLEYAARMVG